MSCVELLGSRLAARDFDCQIAELQVGVAILNRHAALGIPVTQPTGRTLQGKEAAWPSPHLRNKVPLIPFHSPKWCI